MPEMVEFIYYWHSLCGYNTVGEIVSYEKNLWCLDPRSFFLYGRRGAET